jgi:S1-C subfamily serine protease
MKAQFTFLSGSRAGQTDVLSQSPITIGRHPQCELRFDADKDLDVSSRHATVERAGDLWVLRDLGSTNGTYVNGKRLVGEHVLVSRDVIRFGPSGPQVEFTAIPDPRPGPAASPSPPARSSGTVVFGGAQEGPSPPPPNRPQSKAPATPRPTPVATPGTRTKVRIEVHRQTKRLKYTAVGMFFLLVLLSGAYLFQAAETERRLADQRQLLLGQVDSLMHEIETISSGSEGLRAALDSAQSVAEQLKRQLAEAPNDATKINELRRRLDAAMRQQRTLAGVASLDARTIAAENRDAVALVFVEFPNHQVFTGTAFAVRSDPNGGLLITNRHVVSDSNGTLAARIGVVFNGTPQNFRADVVKVHPEADLALIRASVHRGFPIIRNLADSDRKVEMGEPAAVLGFPLGLDLDGGRDWSSLGVAATLTLGTVSRLTPNLIQLDSYSAQGASGSPIFDRRGSVIGVLYGGQSGSNGRIIYGVPIRFVHELLAGQ